MFHIEHYQPHSFVRGLGACGHVNKMQYLQACLRSRPRFPAGVALAFLRVHFEKNGFVEVRVCALPTAHIGPKNIIQASQKLRLRCNYLVNTYIG